MSRVAAGVVIITGGSSGLGRCTASLFAGKGWRVGLIARGVEPLAATCEAIRAAGGVAAFAQADVVHSAALAAAAADLVDALGPVDLWINGAGNGVYGYFGETPSHEFERVTAVTYHGVVNGVRVALAHMEPRGEGRIINICSAVAYHGMPMVTSYAGAKAAVRAFTQALSAELKGRGSPIRVATVFPPGANTPFFSHAVSHLGWPARPAWPVYQPEVVARGVWQAYASGRRETPISGTSALFSLASRLAPGLIAWCMTQLGPDKVISRSPEAAERLEPTLFTPSRRVFGGQGPFGRGAKGWSSQLWLDRQFTRLFGVFSPARGRARARPAVPSAPRRAGLAPHPAPADLDERPGGA